MKTRAAIRVVTIKNGNRNLIVKDYTGRKEFLFNEPLYPKI